ncbi:hypothetical protein ACTQ50_14865, partial [Blautia sp. Sow4_E7]|uniref:hypothetical protein n=1 Tax=Blautia sp. Sow4_E7 TaxID=3438749 RepID=UPI003F92C805
EHSQIFVDFEKNKKKRSFKRKMVLGITPNTKFVYSLTARYFRAVCHWIKERYEAGNTVIFCSISFFVSFCLYFKESCSCTGVHQLVILIKSGCDSLCRRKSGRIPEFSSGISGKLYNSLHRNSSHIRYKLLNFSFRSPLFLTYKCIIDHLKADYVPNEKKKQTKFAEERNYVSGL